MLVINVVGLLLPLIMSKPLIVILNRHHLLRPRFQPTPAYLTTLFPQACSASWQGPQHHRPQS